MNIVSYMEEGNDVIQSVFNEIAPYVEKNSLTTFSYKIYELIADFQKNQIVDGRRTKNLEGQIYEWRITIPRTENLLRILFAWKKNNLILLTGYIIKSKIYEDKHSRETIDKTYKQKIAWAKEVWADCLGSRKFGYSPLIIQ